jgi:predicted acyl esterase
MRLALAALLGLVLAALPAPAAHAGSAPDAGAAFVPLAHSQARFGTKPPSSDPQRQEHVIEAADGTDLYVETWLPAEKDGVKPPERVPVILVMTPYVGKGTAAYENYVELYTQRGYAVAQHHVRGTGESGGCLEQTSLNQIDDGARVVEFLGKDAPYGDGNVGMFGVSYDAETQISVAGLGDPARTKYLKAIVPIASVGGQYEYSFMDGVPYTGFAAQSNAGYLALVSMGSNSAPGPKYIEKMTCQPEVLSSSADQHGNMTPFWAAREYRPGAPSVKAATLYVHGLRDFNVQPITLAGWFDRLPATTPHKGLFGVWEHAFPDGGRVEEDWRRADWQVMSLAWFDRYLKNLPTGVENWPDVQVQDSTGQWRAEPEFPSSGGPAGQLALGPDGAMGVTAPTGSSSYIEGPTEDSANGSLTFETPKLGAPLHIAGQPILDLWLTTDRGDGHVSARLEVLGPDGEVMTHPGEAVHTAGARSLQHLDPMPENYFAQDEARPAPLGEAIQVPLRFQPTDLVVPAGGSLRVKVAGAITYSGRDFEASGVAPQITLLHDCDHPSVLRFLMPHADSPLLNAAEEDDPTPRGTPAKIGLRDGGGIAGAPVCGEAPQRMSNFGPVRAPSSFGTPDAPASRPPAPNVCRDTAAGTVSRVKATLRRKSIDVKGQAFDPGCAGLLGVKVAIARKSGSKCKFVSKRGRFGKARSCAKPTFLAAAGTFDWTLRIRKARLSKGRYTVLAQAADKLGNLTPVVKVSKRVR